MNKASYKGINWTKWGTVIAAVTLLVMIAFELIKNSEKNPEEVKQEVNNSPNSIITIGQVGDNEILIEGSYVKPEIVSQVTRRLNTEVEGVYHHEYRVSVSNPSNRKFRIGAFLKASNFESFKITKFTSEFTQVVIEQGATLYDYLIKIETDKRIKDGDINFRIVDGNK